MADKILRVGTAVWELGGRVNPFQTLTGTQFLGLKSNGDGLTSKVVSMLMASIKKLNAKNQAVQASVADLCCEVAQVSQKKRAQTSTTDSH